MGLVERRAIKKFEDDTYPPLKKRMDAAADFTVPMEIDWESLAVEDYAHLYEEALTKVFFEPLIQAFRGITIDQMGKDALKKGLKKVILRYTGEGNSFLDSGNLFKEGTLTLDHHPVTNIDDVDERARAIQGALEKGL